jgi:uncharacterized protein (DUF2147 family)
MMNKAVLGTLSMLWFLIGVPAGYANAQDTASSAAGLDAASTEQKSGFDALPGLWARPDGGYLNAIQGVDADGALDAVYANPYHLPFAKAEASRDGDAIRVFLELRAGGYNGSTYDLTYDPAEDVLRGVYYQAVARQKYDVRFERVR